jgi:pimeloyl-ACP methyl ester carboxylesterase
MTEIPVDNLTLPAHERAPAGSTKLALFIQGTGSSRHSPRNNFVAERLERAGISSLLFDLLTEEEDSRRARFNIPQLSARVFAVIDYIKHSSPFREHELHLFGASTGAAAAIHGALNRPQEIRSVVSRGGRPDLADEALEQLQHPLLLIVGGDDHTVLRLNREAADKVAGEHDLRVVPGAGHLFEEPGALEQVADHAARWITAH